MTDASTTALSGRDVMKDVIASAIGSAACVYTGQPFDTIKVRMQCVTEDADGGAVRCLINTYRKEGLWAFWRGSLPALSGALSENAMAFGVNGILTRVFDKYTTMDQQSNTRSFLTGSITGLCTALILCPADIVKCRAQLQRARGGTGNVKEIMRNIIQNEGYSGFYTGIHTQIARDIPFYFFFFGSYELLCSQLRRYFPKMPDSSIYFISGGIAGQVAWAASIPVDAVKSIVQTQETKVKAMDVYRNIVRTSGYSGLMTFCYVHDLLCVRELHLSVFFNRFIFLGLYNGVGVAIIRAFPANAALFLGYELTSKFLRFWNFIS